jgi:hypothetical protein
MNCKSFELFVKLWIGCKGGKGSKTCAETGWMGLRECDRIAQPLKKPTRLAKVIKKCNAVLNVFIFILSELVFGATGDRYTAVRLDLDHTAGLQG